MVKVYSGGLLGNVPVAQLADTFGRKWVFMACYLSSILITILRVYLHTYLADMVLYVLLGATSAVG